MFGLGNKRAASQSPRSNYLWWAVFFLGFYVMVFSKFFASAENPLAALNVSTAKAGIVQTAAALLIALGLTLPLLLFRFRKAALSLVALLFAAPLAAMFVGLSKTDDGAGLYVLLLPPLVGYFIAGYLLLVGLPVLLQKKINLDTKISSLLAAAVIVVETVAALFLTAIALYASYLATSLPTLQATPMTASERAACERLEQISQYLKPWRDQFRKQCPLGVGEQLAFPTISDEMLRQHATTCNVQRLFSNRSSSLSGLCLKDQSGYFTTSEELVREEFLQYNQDRPVDCNYLSSLDFQFLNSEEEILTKMQQLCVPPAAQ